jgi:class 3 adenylate cyclase
MQPPGSLVIDGASSKCPACNQRISLPLMAYVKTTGDGFLAIFDSATRAVRCAAAMTRSARGLELHIRVGVHTGEVEFSGGDARGIAVHAAARILSLAGPDEVLVSSTTSELLEGSGLILEDAGTHELKGISGARHVFRLVDVGT